MIAGLELAKGSGTEVIEAKCDSLLMVNQVNRTFEVREDRMQRYLDKLQVNLHRFKEWTLQHVPQEQNSQADALVNLGSSVKDDEISLGTVVQLSRSVLYIEYLKNGKLPSDPRELRTLRTKVARFTLAEDGTLYRRMLDGPLAICLGPGDTDYVLQEIHEGICGNYSGAESLVHKVIRAGYYWADMEKYTKQFVRKCDKCQRCLIEDIKLFFKRSP
ncbi:uncharacterized protein [Nicotiana tomentosiformis]|uniref:uncharacterized protein n=1 Tax=Nicotiana tomentosiformis TaxID=4098 RepID=UPI00388C6EF5